jgi:alcohol dehydrogenase
MKHSLNKLGGMPVKLSNAGVKKEQLKKIAESAINDGAMLPNPKNLIIDDIMKILNDAF